MTEIELCYTGGLADRHALDFYDASRALAGFQRSLALVTHLVVNGEIITQAPSLRNAQIIIEAPEEGSWRTRALIVFGAAWAALSAGADSPAGQVITSIYDYILNETMGFHVDYDKTLQQQYREHLQQKGITREKLDSLMEKTESSISEMHRPIRASETAKYARVIERRGGRSPRELGPIMSYITADYIATTVRSEDSERLTGVVSSYNINTFKGRLFSYEHNRPIAFELMEQARRPATIGLITRSLQLNSAKRDDPRAVIDVSAHKLESSTGRLKSLHVTEARAPEALP